MFSYLWPMLCRSSVFSPAVWPKLVFIFGIDWPNLTGSLGMLPIICGLALYSIPARQKVLQIS